MSEVGDFSYQKGFVEKHGEVLVSFLKTNVLNVHLSASKHYKWYLEVENPVKAF